MPSGHQHGRQITSNPDSSRDGCVDRETRGAMSAGSLSFTPPCSSGSVPDLLQKRFDEVEALRTAEAGHQIETLHCRVLAAAATGDIMEHPGVVALVDHVVHERIQETDARQAFGSRFLIGQRDEACPDRRSEAGARAAAAATTAVAEI